MSYKKYLLAFLITTTTSLTGCIEFLEEKALTLEQARQQALSIIPDFYNLGPLTPVAEFQNEDRYLGTFNFELTTKQPISRIVAQSDDFILLSQYDSSHKKADPMQGHILLKGVKEGNQWSFTHDFAFRTSDVHRPGGEYRFKPETELTDLIGDRKVFRMSESEYDAPQELFNFLRTKLEGTHISTIPIIYPTGSTELSFGKQRYFGWYKLECKPGRTKCKAHILDSQKRKLFSSQAKLLLRVHEADPQELYFRLLHSSHMPDADKAFDKLDFRVYIKPDGSLFLKNQDAMVDMKKV